MNKKVLLICSIIEIIIGLFAIISFIILIINGENIVPWIMALILLILLVLNGIKDIFK